MFHWRHGARERYFSATRCERFRCVHHEIPVGRNKAAGKFYEGNSVSPTFCGQNAREDVLSEFLREKYARARVMGRQNANSPSPVPLASPGV